MTTITFPNRRRISDETVAEIRRCFREGMTVKEIALLYHISTAKVSVLCSPCRERKPPKIKKPAGRSGRRSEVSDETIRDILTLLNTNKYGELEIARMLDVSRSAVARVRDGSLVPEPEQCPKCGRVTVLPCLACRLRQGRRVPVYDLPIRLELELEPQDFARYLEVRQEGNAMRDQAELWNEYTQTKSVEARNAIVSVYTPVASTRRSCFPAASSG